MNGRKNFHTNLKNQPNEPVGERVVSERGRKELPPSTRGGENLKPNRYYEHKQHAFDSFCKKVLKCEAYNGYREISRRQSREVAFSELPEDSMEQLASYDRYPWEYTFFPVGGDVILIEDDRLAEALNALPQDGRDILLMYFFLDMADREIAERMNMARRTVNARRQKAYRLLKELMGGDVDG
jgi:RNA polymerase sigma factor (sigma-70 family)